MTSDVSPNVSPVTPVSVGPYECGPSRPLLIIAGPCVLQSDDLCREIAKTLSDINQRDDVSVVFKASFDKANRTSLHAGRGPGLEEGMAMLQRVKSEFGLPVTTDIHLPDQAKIAAKTCDLLQIPAFLARQTDLVVAAAKTGRPVNIKKGQFMSAPDMKYVLEKVRQTDGNGGVMLCERGTFFGYGRLVNDFAGFHQMRTLGVPVVFDATHSVQQPGGLGGATGGNRALVEPLARAAVAIGTDALFFETHPDPETSPSDGPNMIPLDQFAALVERLGRLRSVAVEITESH